MLARQPGGSRLGGPAQRGLHNCNVWASLRSRVGGLGRRCELLHATGISDMEKSICSVGLGLMTDVCFTAAFGRAGAASPRRGATS